AIGGTAFAQTTNPAAGEDPAVAGTQTSSPGNASPERDARGIPVVSDPAEVPAGANDTTPVPPGAVFTPNPNQQSVFAPPASAPASPAWPRTGTRHSGRT